MTQVAIEPDDEYLAMEIDLLVEQARATLAQEIGTAAGIASKAGHFRSSRHYILIVEAANVIGMRFLATMADFFVEHPALSAGDIPRERLFDRKAQVLIENTKSLLPSYFQGNDPRDFGSVQNLKAFDELFAALNKMVKICNGRIHRNIFSNGKSGRYVTNNYQNSNISQVTGSSQIVVQQGRDSLTQIAGIAVPRVKQFIVETRELLNSLDISDQQRLLVAQSVDQLDVMVKSPEPNTSLIQATGKYVLATLGAIADGAAVYELLEKFKDIF